MTRVLESLPNALCYARIILTAATYGIVWTGDVAAFTVAVLLIVITDMLDGPLARRFGRAGTAGADLDSVSDYFFYASFPVWAWFLVPDVMPILIPAVIVYLAAYTGANVLARIRLGQIGFHNRFTRLAATAGVVFAIVTVLWGLQLWLLAAVLAIGAVDLFERYRRILTAPPPRQPGPFRAARDADD